MVGCTRRAWTRASRTSLKKQLKRRTLRSKATHAGWTGVISADGIGGIVGGSTADVIGGATTVGSCVIEMPWCTSKMWDFLKSETTGFLKPLPGSMGSPLGTDESCEPTAPLMSAVEHSCARARWAHTTSQAMRSELVGSGRAERMGRRGGVAWRHAATARWLPRALVPSLVPAPRRLAAEGPQGERSPQEETVSSRVTDFERETTPSSL